MILTLLVAGLLPAAPTMADDDRGLRCNASPSSATINEGGQVSFVGSARGGNTPYTFSWSFPGGSPASANSARQTVTYASATGSPFTATLTVEDSSRRTRVCTDSSQITVRPAANQAPTANANGPYSGTSGVAVSFSSAGSTDPDGTIASYAWNFGDGGTSSQPNPSHVYGAPGGYTVTLTVTDNDGATDSDSTTATISSPANVPPTADAGGPYSGTAGQPVSFDGSGSSDSDGTIASYAWTFGDGGTGSGPTPSHTYAAAGNYTVTLTVRDNGNAAGSDTTSATITAVSACAPFDPNAVPNTSINSTSVNSECQNTSVVSQVNQVPNGSYSILAINDLGMHCGDLDTRISSILPPFQVLLGQVIRKGATPVLNPAGVSLRYSAAANPNDPGLAAGLPGLMADGSTYKTNYWTTVIDKGAYNAFYPFDIDALMTENQGLPVPNVATLYIDANGNLVHGTTGIIEAVQHAMPGITTPYITNEPQDIREHYTDKPFFVDFPFGYVAEDVNWYEGAGIPLSAFDDFGRENAYPLVRVEARSGTTTLSTVDTVLPISGEASCTNCHATEADYISINGPSGHRTNEPTDTLANNGLPVATSLDDPDLNMPPKVSLEYAADINILRLHDLKHGASYVAPSGDGTAEAAPCDISANGGDGDGNCLINKALVQAQPVVCQVCHYTPALDLAHVGPKTGPVGTGANGRNQLAHKSNSNVMHSHHGQFADLFTAIPPPQQAADGTITNQTQRLAALEESCYQCHPGKSTQCLRGAMFNGGMLCSDCHGGMEQVGADFSANVSPANPGAFVLDQGNFYDPASNQPRVPWANEPGCGSCHTGDASNNLTSLANTLVNTVDTNGNNDGIRLRQAYRSGDAKATPIVPTNKRFAEPAVPVAYKDGSLNPGAGNPQLFRVSTGHGGVMCEGCHGATHAEWPNANPNANDNVTSQQLQGHSGTIVECTTCHGSAMNSQITLGGPHGMHPVGGNTSFANGGHEHINTSGCSACHGPGDRRSNAGTVLSLAKADRVLRGTLVRKGEPVGCSVCHGGGGLDD